jgi:acyl-CoA thioesterase-1
MKRWLAFVLVSLCLVSCQKVAPKLNSTDVVMVFGDSLTFGYGAPPEASYPAVLEKMIGVKVVNEGVSGNTTADGLKRIDAALVKHKPALVLLSLGGNDMLRNVPASEIKTNLKAMVERVIGSGAGLVLISQPQPSLIGGLVGLSDAAVYAELAKEEGVFILEESFSKHLSDKDLKSDLIHLNAKGYALVAEDVAKKLKVLGYVE